jgi:hypothetical protein
MKTKTDIKTRTKIYLEVNISKMEIETQRTWEKGIN